MKRKTQDIINWCRRYIPLFDKLWTWGDRRYLLHSGKITKERFLSMESWVKKRWPVVDWHKVVEISINTQQWELTWEFPDWEHRFPGCGNITYPFEKHSQKLLNPKKQDYDDYWDDNTNI